MNKLIFPKGAGLAATVFLTLSSLLAQESDTRPNLIVILADDMGVTDIGAFHELYPGATEEQLAHRYTPNLDRLAKEGVRCTRAYAAAWCAPSRQMLLSGQWVNRRNAYDHPWIGSQLRQEGYVTGLVGKSHGGRPIAKTCSDMSGARAPSRICTWPSRRSGWPTPAISSRFSRRGTTM